MVLWDCKLAAGGDLIAWPGEKGMPLRGEGLRVVVSRRVISTLADQHPIVEVSFNLTPSAMQQAIR